MQIEQKYIYLHNQAYLNKQFMYLFKSSPKI